jgi:hypothetical protein
VKLRASTPDLVAKAFADAVAAGEHEAAEGWLAVAAYAEERHAARHGRRVHPRLQRRPDARPLREPAA